ncbi:MAG TPA: diguanylate cyclase [Anaeromyxobacter sp.]
MPGRILVVEESRPVVAALRRALEPLGFRLDAVAPSSAAARLDPGEHEVAVVRAGPKAAALVSSLREAAPALSVVALFEEEGSQRRAEALGADGFLVGPLSQAAIASTCAMAAGLHERRRRVAELEAALAAAPAAPADRELDFLKRTMFAEVKRSRRYRYPIALALVSLDGWQEAAAKLGARARARLLAEVLAALSSAVRDIDVAVPFAQERFVVLMPHTPAEGAMKVSRRLCARVRDREGTPRLTASVGVACHDGEGPVSFSLLVRRASEALTHARSEGGDRAEAEAALRRDRSAPEAP